MLKTEGNKSYYAYGEDFDDVPNDDTFVMDGLCYNEHMPNPGLIELKQVIAPVRGWLEGPELVLRNELNFVTLDDLTADYKVESFGDRYANTHGRIHAESEADCATGPS